MKVDMSKIQVNQAGVATITIDDIEDFWVLANIIRQGDKIQAPIRRKIVKVSQTGKTDSRNIITKAIVKITEIEFQPGVNEMHLRGTLVHDVEDAREGSFQRILLEPGRPFSISKKCWDKFTYEELEDAGNPISNAAVAAVIMQSGLAHICIIGRNTTVVKQKVTKSIPKVKAHGSSGKNQEAKIRFFELTAEALMREVDVANMKCIIVASPGFLQKEFVQYLRDHQSQLNLQSAFSANKFVEGTVPSGYPQELEALLSQPEMQTHVQELKAAKQAKTFESLMVEMNNDTNTVLFGHQRVIDAAKQGAVKTLLVTDNFIHTLELNERLKFLELKDQLEQGQTDVVIFSTRHQSGEQLEELGGVAAILRYAIEPPPEDVDDVVDFD